MVYSQMMLERSSKDPLKVMIHCTFFCDVTERIISTERFNSIDSTRLTGRVPLSPFAAMR